MRLLLQLLIASSFVSFAASAPAKGESGNDIIGGRPAQNGQWPWQVYLGIHKPSTGRTSLCGGSLISRRHIVTAAHCTLGVEAHNIRAMLGSVKQYDTTQNNPSTLYLDAQRVVVHPKYTGNDPSYRNDISIIELEADVEFNVNTQPIKIRKNDSALNYDGAYVYVTGWGRTSATSFVSPTLMETRIPILEHRYCISRWQAISYGKIIVDSTQICAGSYRRGTAPGDSGGPLVVQGADQHWNLVGLTSFGDNSAAGLEDQLYYPGVYLRLSQYCDFVSSSTRYLAFCW